MPTIRIKDLDKRGFLSFDLQDLIDLLGEAALQSLWTCEVEEVISRDLPIDLEAAFNSPQGHDGRTLARLASLTRQVIDGHFEGRDLHSERPWIRLTAVDSSYWEVWAETEKLLEPIKVRFVNVDRVNDA